MLKTSLWKTQKFKDIQCSSASKPGPSNTQRDGKKAAKRRKTKTFFYVIISLKKT